MYSGSCRSLPVSCTGLSPSLAGFPKTILLSLSVTYAVRTPRCTHHGLGSAGSARRYSRHRCFFLFLRLLRCFSSPGSPPYVMDWRTDTRGLLVWVSPFRHPRINGYLLLPAAFRSLSRLSSALSAKASTLRSSSLYLPCIALHGRQVLCFLLVSGLNFLPRDLSQSFPFRHLGCLVDLSCSVFARTREQVRSFVVFAEYNSSVLQPHPYECKHSTSAPVTRAAKLFS